MKKLLLSILLMCYTIVMFKPVLPFIADCISHAFFYTQHMATVHYENGKYHVHYEAAKNVKEDATGKTASSSSSKKDTAPTEYISATLFADFIIHYFSNTHSFTNSPSLMSGITNNNYPPPRF